MTDTPIDPKQQTLLNKCLNELIKRKIDFCISFCDDGSGYIENGNQEHTISFFLGFDSDDIFSCFNDYDGPIKNINTIEELLKLRPFY